MGALELFESVGGGLLLFVLPGLTLSRALFPEWRFRGADGARHALETATLAFVLSVALTILVGTGLLGLAPGGFAASWSDPALEVALAAVAAVALVAGLLRGAYSRVPPVTGGNGPDPGGEDAWVLDRELARLHREERVLARRARAVSADGPQEAAIVDQRAELKRRIESLEQSREEEYAR